MMHIPLVRRTFCVLAAPLAVACLLVTAGGASAQTPATPRAAAGRALDRGNYAEVHTLLAGLDDDTPAAVLRARAYMAVGQYADAEKVLLPAVAENPIGDAAVELGILQRLLGKREALRTLSLILSRDIVAASAPDYVRAGRAARALRRFQDANGFFRQANAQAPTDVGVNVAWGELFLEAQDRKSVV